MTEKEMREKFNDAEYSLEEARDTICNVLREIDPDYELYRDVSSLFNELESFMDDTIAWAIDTGRVTE